MYKDDKIAVRCRALSKLHFPCLYTAAAPSCTSTNKT